MEELLRRALADPERGLAEPPPVEDAALEMLAQRSGGDARVALSALERAVERRASGETVDVAAIEDALQRKAIDYDREGDRHYDFISAWIKATRGSDVDASLYYLAVMLEGGEDPRFIARRMVILASEDVGNADPQALLVADAAARAVDRVGLPECALNLAQAAVYLALAPKSNASYKGLSAARAEVRENGAKTPPDYLRDAHYPGAKKLGRGEGYRYAHDEPGGVSDQQLLPDGLGGEPLLRAHRPRLRGGAGQAPGSAAQENSQEMKEAQLPPTAGVSMAAFQARARESRHTGRRPGLGVSGRRHNKGSTGGTATAPCDGPIARPSKRREGRPRRPSRLAAAMEPLELICVAVSGPSCRRGRGRGIARFWCWATCGCRSSLQFSSSAAAGAGGQLWRSAPPPPSRLRSPTGAGAGSIGTCFWLMAPPSLARRGHRRADLGGLLPQRLLLAVIAVVVLYGAVEIGRKQRRPARSRTRRQAGWRSR